MRPLRVLGDCEYSGVVRDAFAALGHDAMSCDLLPTEREGSHYEGSIFDVVDGREARVHLLPPSADRWKLRSTTYQGIADAMAAQWSAAA